MSNSPVLEVKDLTMRFGGITAVSGLNLSVNSGSIVALIGPNGAGKTTAFNVISGFYQSQEGQIRFQNQDITKASPYKVCELGMARTFQNIRLFENLTAIENVMVGCHVRRKHGWWGAVLNLPSFNREEEDIKAQAYTLLKRLGLESYANEKATSLAYGVQRRLEIARALATQPKFLMLDEPAAGMNPQESQELMQHIRHIREEFSLTVLLIEHDMKFVMGLCEHIWVLEYGELIAEGNPESIRNNSKVIEAYLGEDISHA